ncbi:hypothetical protein ACIA8O_36225 [Kitasatospora sp. NPDC051853]|uniref:hypothetical protein n=1 Tax=Kitasatospora sp. NPDC051853 TaxID=3364058 RepID=UPI0037A38558
MRRRAGAALVAAVLLAGPAACAGSSRTDDDYRHKAAHTLGSAVAAARTITTGVDGAAAGDLTSAFTSVLVREADEDLTAAADSFRSRQPPSVEADELRSQVDELLHQAERQAAELRIATQRGESAPTAELAATADRMEQEQEALR